MNKSVRRNGCDRINGRSANIMKRILTDFEQ